jgi:hypothetical protein
VYYPHTRLVTGSMVMVARTTGNPLAAAEQARRAIQGLDTVIKIEEFRERIYRSYDDGMRAIRTLPKVVSVDTIRNIAQQLVALHRPATFDWAAKFGLPPTHPASALTTPGQAKPSPNAGVVCERCGSAVTPRVEAYARDHADEFENRLLCFDCQRAMRRARSCRASAEHGRGGIAGAR